MHTWSAPASWCAWTRAGDRRLVTPHDERVDEPVAAAIREVVIGEALALPVVRVVRQGEVAAEVEPGRGPGLLRIRLQDDALLAGNETVGTDPRPSLGRELGGDQVRVGAGRTGPGELQHLRAERSQHPGVLRQRDLRRVQAVEVLGHLGQRLRVGAGLVDGIDQGPMADPEPTEEPRSVLGGQSSVLRGRLVRRVHPDVEDAGGDGARRRCREQVGDRAEQLPADVRQPQRRVAETLELGAPLGGLRFVAIAKYPTPDAGTAEPCRHLASLPRPINRRRPRRPALEDHRPGATRCAGGIGSSPEAD